MTADDRDPAPLAKVLRSYGLKKVAAEELATKVVRDPLPFLKTLIGAIQTKPRE